LKQVLQGAVILTAVAAFAAFDGAQLRDGVLIGQGETGGFVEFFEGLGEFVFFGVHGEIKRGGFDDPEAVLTPLGRYHFVD
jgi:hypothetical protein